MTEKLRSDNTRHEGHHMTEFRLFTPQHALVGGSLTSLDEDLAHGLTPAGENKDKTYPSSQDTILFDRLTGRLSGIGFDGHDRIRDALKTANYLSDRFVRNPSLRIGYVVPSERVAITDQNHLEVQGQLAIESGDLLGMVFLLFPALEASQISDARFNTTPVIEQVRQSVQTAQEAGTISDSFTLVDQFGRRIPLSSE
ncbi:MAG: hypothetical protein AAB478_03840 [Patescibacteria group bacterium]